MRNTYLLLLVFALSHGIVSAQNNATSIDVVADFENLSLEPGSYWNGSDISGQFMSGLATFPNDYNPDWHAWNQWAYSNMADDTTAGFLNQYSAITAGGYDPLNSGGSTYGVAYVISDFISTELIPVPLRFADGNPHHPIGFYVTNGTYPALAMEYGDEYSKKFGGETGNDPDFFKLMVWGMRYGYASPDTVEFYLADYRFENNEEDYIVKSWEWVDLEILGDADSLMFSLESSDVGMFGMNTPAFFCVDNLTVKFENTAVSDYISEVLAFIPAPGQQINEAPWGIPSSVNTIIGGIEGSMSLGAFGGYTIFQFDHAVENDPDNPFGVDFTIFGNPLEGSSEAGQVYVMKDDNWNGLPDDQWYLLAGSDHWFSGSRNDYQVTYFNPGSATDVPWEDNKGGYGYILANSIHTQPYYPQADSFPEVDPVQYLLGGYNIEGSIDTTNPVYIKSYQRAFGYADNLYRGAAPYHIPDNPYTKETENSGGDAFDISWAIDSAGNYIDLEFIHFIKVQTAVMGDLGWLGEISTEITGAVDVHPDHSITGPAHMIVVKDLPPVIATPSIQLEAFAYHYGRWQANEEIVWETGVTWAEVDNENVLHLEQSGTFELKAYLASDPSIETSMECVVDFTYNIPEFSQPHSLLYPNPAGDRFCVAGAENARIEIIGLSGRLLVGIDNYSDTQEILIDDLPAGIYMVRVSGKGNTVVHKLFKH